MSRRRRARSPTYHARVRARAAGVGEPRRRRGAKPLAKDSHGRGVEPSVRGGCVGGAGWVPREGGYEDLGGFR